MNLSRFAHINPEQSTTAPLKLRPYGAIEITITVIIIIAKTCKKYKNSKHNQQLYTFNILAAFTN